MKKTLGGRVLSVLVTLLLLTGLCSIGFGAAAEEHVIISIHNTSPGTDVNPFLRFVAKKELFQSGGPFTVKLDVKVENFKRMSTKEGPSCFFNVLTLEYNQGKQEGGQVSILQNTDGWQEMRRNADSQWVTFSNVDKGCLIDGVKQDYYLLDIGIYYAKADAYFSNFRIENAAGKVVYSWDTDRDLQALMNDAASKGKDKANLRDIGLFNPEPCILATGFGNNSSQIYVYKGDVDTFTPVETTTTQGAVYEDPEESDATTAPTGETTAPTDETTASTDETSPSSETETTAPSSETTATTPDSSAPEKKGGLGVGAIIGIIAGAVVVLGGGSFGVLFAMKKLPFQQGGPKA